MNYMNALYSKYNLFLEEMNDSDVRENIINYSLTPKYGKMMKSLIDSHV